MTYSICLMLWLLSAAALLGQGNSRPTAVDRAFDRMYNFDFPSVHAILEEEARIHPEDPLLYSVRAAAYLYSEFDRLKILELEFFTSDDRVTGKRTGKPDPAARAQLFQMTAEARRRAAAILAVDPREPNAIFALCMAAGVETDYTSLLEKKYFRSYSLSKEEQKYAQKLLALTPPVCDAYLVLGSTEYVVGSMNFFFRLFVRFDRIQGSKQKAVEHLRKVIDGGRYYPPFAKILLSVIYLREKQPDRALVLLKELEQDFPQNPLIRKEVALVSETISRSRKGSR
jgi:hypothetical protein